MLTLSGPEFRILRKILQVFQDRGLDAKLTGDEKKTYKKFIAHVQRVKELRSGAMPMHQRAAPAGVKQETY